MSMQSVLSALSALRAVVTAPARYVHRRATTVRDPRPRREYYDGTERVSYDDPSRYARGTKAVPAPPPATM